MQNRRYFGTRFSPDHWGRGARARLLGAVSTVLLTGAACDRQCDRGDGGGPGLPAGHYPANISQAADTEFVRFVDEGDYRGRLETAVATYEGPGGEKVELISAVHIADAGYYSDLNVLFATYDSLLYEMVKPQDMGAPTADEGRGSLLGMFQKGMGGSMGLAYQLEGIDYGAANFVHADLDAETFAALSEERGQGVVALMLQSMWEQAKMALAGDGGAAADPLAEYRILAALLSKDRERKLKYLFAKQLGDVEAITAAMMTDLDGEESVLLTERNKAAMRVLRERLAAGEKKLGLFYGGAHLADIEARIFAEVGLRRTGVRWLRAWEIE